MKTPEGGSLTKTMKKRLVHLEGGIVEVAEAYNKVKKALCGNTNVPLGEVLQTVDQLKSRLAQVECERNAAVKDLADACKYCKHISCDDEDENSPCKDCMQRKDGVPFSPMIRTRFEWRGVCEENTKEDTSNDNF